MSYTKNNRSISEHRKHRLNRVSLALILATIPTLSFPQEIDNSADENEEVYTLSPFTVEGSKDVGYRATSTLAGTRISSRLEDVGSAISVLTEEFLQDVGGVDNETVLAYALGTEVAGPRGNFTGISASSDQTESNIHEEGAFSNPNGRNRIRGLASADSTRNFFRSDIPWDGYNVNRVDIQRGPNAMLFGLGSPAGVINATTNSAHFSGSEGQFETKYDQFGSWRISADYNTEVIDDQLAVRVSVLNDDQKFRRSPAFEKESRQYIATKYKPHFMNSDGTRLEFTGSFERGENDSNRPRSLAPYDFITPFFLDADAGGNEQGTIDLRTPEGRTAYNGVPNIAPIWEIGPMFTSGAGIAQDSVMQIPAWAGTRNTSGTVSNFNFVWGDYRAQRPMTRLEYAAANPDSLSEDQKLWYDLGLFGQNSIQDPNIFDFYNLQFDGPNKGEYRNWTAYDFDITNTYWNDRAGFNLTYHREDVENGRYSWMNTLNHRIYIDMNETLRDLSIESGEVVATPNPNVGRAFVQHVLGEANDSYSDRESVRFSAFAEFDMRDKNEGWVGKLIGKHRLNYAYEDQTNELDSRSQQSGGFGPDFYNRVLPGQNYLGSAFLGVATWRDYVSDDLRGLSLNEVKLTNVKTDLYEKSAGAQTVRFFDPTWIAGDIYGDQWITPDGQVSTQNLNPSNYAGWTTETFNFYNMTQPDEKVVGTDLTAREYLTQRARLSSSNIKSDVLVLQSYFWNDSIVGTYGYREDTEDSFFLEAGKLPGLVSENTDPEVYFFGNENGNSLISKGSNTNWSVAVHLNRLLGDRDFLPFNLTLSYNEGENTRPGDVARTDIFNNLLPSRSGKTRDEGIIISTKDNKYSLRVIEYKTEIKNDNMGGSLANFQIQQALTFPARRREEIRQGIFQEDKYVANGGNLTNLYNTLVPAWDEFAQTLENDPRFDGLIDYWFDDGSITNFVLPSIGDPGTTMTFRGQGTRDTVSTGTEFEFTANPVANWRIMFNASKNKAVIDNAPGDALEALLTFLDDQFMNTPVGDMPHEPDGSNITREAVWRPYRGVFVPLLAKNGKTTDEIREWRYSLISNYNFTDGKFSGFGVGGAYRYQDPQILEYALTRNEDGFVVPDLEKPIKGPDQKTVDLWASYKMKLTDSIDWRIQLNLYNAFGKNKAIPINADPDGTPNAIRVEEGTSWALSNTFEF